MTLHLALTVAGSDPTGGAGLEQDLRVFERLGVHGAAVATALTVQDSARVHDVVAVPAPDFRRRLDVLLADLAPDAVKTGMLFGARHVDALVAALDGAGSRASVVVDPVMLSSSGHPLLDEEGVAALRDLLVPRAAVVTPNLAEARRLCGREGDARTLARRLLELGCRAVVITGGDADEPDAIDVLADADGVRILGAARVPGPSPHGTGCAFAAAVAAGLAVGVPIAAAVVRAKELVRRAIAAAARPPGARARGGRPFLSFRNEELES